MAFARWQASIVDQEGNVLPSAQITVRREVSGAPLAVLYSDRDGVTPLGNPFPADGDGFAAFHVLGGAHRIDVTSGAFSRTYRYVAIGTKAEQDADPDLDAIAALAGVGFLTRLTDESWAQRVITGTAGEITVTDGDGDAGNPTLSLPARVDLGGKVLEIPNDAAPVVDATGEIAIDTTVTDFAAGVLKYFSGEAMGVVAMPVAQFTSPSDGDVPTYNAATDQFEMQAAAGSGPVLETAQPTTSGTTFDFTIPSSANRVQVILDQVSLSGTDDLLVQLGDSGGIETSGYVCSSGNRVNEVTSTAGFILQQGGNAANLMSGVMTLVRISGNIWIGSHAVTKGGAPSAGAGSKTLSAALTTVRLTRTGTNTFDAGSVTVLHD